MTILELLGIIALVFGLVFCVIGILGFMRMPDVLTRVHAIGVVSTFGLFGLLVGAALLMPSLTFKLIALGIFLFIAAPLTSHAIARAAERQRDSEAARIARVAEVDQP